MRKNRIGLVLLDLSDNYGEFPDQFNGNMDKIQSLIEDMMFEIKTLKEDIRKMKYGSENNEWP